MSKKNNEVNVVEVTNEAAVEEVRTKETVRAEIDELIEKRNNLAENGAYALVNKKDNDIGTLISEYTDLCRKECFATLATKKNPMLEAVKMLSFDTIKLADDKENSTNEFTLKKIDPAKKAIDPLQLHKAVKGGIGANKSWSALVEKLNYLLTARRAIELGINPEVVSNTYSMSEEADKITALLFDVKKYDKTKADEILKHDLQVVVDAMIGEIFTGKGEARAKVEVADELVNWLLMVYQKKDNKKALSVTCSNHKNMRGLMMEACNRVACGTAYTLNYVVKK